MSRVIDVNSGYMKDKDNIHHIVMEAVVEALEDVDSHAVVTVADDEIKITGYGSTTSRTLQLHSTLSPA